MRLQQPWSMVMPSIIDATERDKDLAQLQSQIHAQMRGAFITAIERAQERGELPALKMHASWSLPSSARFCTVVSSLVSRLMKCFAKKVVERALRNAN